MKQKKNCVLMRADDVSKRISAGATEHAQDAMSNFVERQFITNSKEVA